MSSRHFALFRIAFGTYLALHFLQLVPYAGELFGAGGLLADPALNPTHGLFPSPLSLPLDDSALVLWLAGSALLAGLFAAGIARHAAAVLLWFSWTALFHRNNLIANPSLAYVGLLLVLTLLVPRGEALRPAAGDPGWEMPLWVPRCAWILMAAGYSFSGLTKLGSASWIDGSALLRLLDNPLARPGFFRDALLALPEPLLALATWGALLAELLFVPLAFWWRTRPWAWLAMVAMHLGILLVVDFADLSLGMLMIHLFTVPNRWLDGLHRLSRPPRLIRARPEPKLSPR